MKTALQLTSTTPVSETAIDAIRAAYTTANAAIHHGTCAHALGRAAAELYDEARESVARLINTPHPSNILFAPSEVSALELLARSYALTLEKGDEIILTASEPDSMRRVWAFVAARYQLVLRVIDPDDTGDVSFEAVASVLSSRTRLAVLHIVCPLRRTLVPLQDISEFLKGAGVTVVLNATHALPYTRVDVSHIRPDFLVADGGALGAPQSAFLYGAQEQLKRLPPCFGGDEVLDDFSVDANLNFRNWSDIPERFSVGMPSISCAAALGAVAQDLSETVDDTFIQQSEKLAAHLASKLQACPRVVLYGGTANHRIPTAAFNVEGLDALVVADALRDEGIVLESGACDLHMAHVHQFDCSSSLRVAFNPRRHQRRNIDNFIRKLSISIQSLG